MSRSKRQKKFGNIAGIYDLIVKVSSGDLLQKASSYFVHELPEVNKCIIIGGGTGDVISVLEKSRKVKEIHFMEPDTKMLYKAKQKGLPARTVILEKKLSEHHPKETYDIAFASFFLDIFTEDEAREQAVYIYDLLKPQGLFICTDFQHTSGWFSPLFRAGIFFLYRFFRLFTNISARSLPPLFSIVEKKSFLPQRTRTYLFGSIRTTLYKKTL